MEREDRVIYTSHYNNITSVHFFFFFPKSLMMQKYKTNKTLNLLTHKKQTNKRNKFYNLSLQFVLCQPWSREGDGK